MKRISGSIIQAMKNDENLLEAARSIRPFLADLAPDQAVELDKCLSDYLAEASAGQSVTNKIVKNLTTLPRTKEWLEAFLELGKPPSTQVRAFAPPLGDPSPVLASRYVCPQGDYTWYQMSAGSPIPRCTTHGIALVAAP